MSENAKKPLTTAAGIPVADNQNSMTAGERGPLLVQDFHLIEKLAHFNRERIPERVVHAKGAGAYGYFEVTHDVTQWTKADFLSEVGKRTEIFIRFSTVGGERGSADTDRDPRGFAIKFYTQQGNYDIVGNNTPVFFLRDPLKFPDMVHTHKRNPATNCKDPNAFWDFHSRTPESLHQITILFSSRGTPKSYRHMHGFSSHTFKWVNAEGKGVWVKYHFKTETGVENWTAADSGRLSGEDPDYATRDLYNHIQGGGIAAWKAYVQIMPLEDAASYRFNPFDLTKVWYYKDYPLIPIGRLVLDRNPENYFAEVEQAAFTPANLVPGVEPSPDKMLQARLFAYGDAQRYRLGANHQMLPVNRPHAAPIHSHQRDGAMRFDDNGGGTPNYEPNSYDGIGESPEHTEHRLPLAGAAGRYAPSHDDDFEQPGALYRVLSDEEKARLVENLTGHLKHAERSIQVRQVKQFYRADTDYGTRVAQGLGIDVAEISA
ncbi:MAG: catalase [Blastocatellia bacterium]|nr:catalase [Blastocatellia bacterium]